MGSCHVPTSPRHPRGTYNLNLAHLLTILYHFCRVWTNSDIAEIKQKVMEGTDFSQYLYHPVTIIVLSYNAYTTVLHGR